MGWRQDFNKEKEEVLNWAKEYKVTEPIPKGLKNEDGESYIEDLEKVYTNWSGIPENSDYFSFIETLDIDEIRYLPDSFFSVFNNLKELNLIDCECLDLPKIDHENSTLEIIDFSHNENTIRIDDSFMNFTALKSLKFPPRSFLSGGLQVSKKLSEWLLEKKLIENTDNLHIYDGIDKQITIEDEEYVLNKSIITLIVDNSGDIIKSKTYEKEMIFSDISKDNEVTLAMNATLEDGSISSYNKETEIFKKYYRDEKISLQIREFEDYNHSMSLERTEGYIGSFDDEISILLRVPKDVIKNILYEANQGKTKMAVSISVLTYASASQVNSMSEYEHIYNRDILLVGSHKAILAQYVTRRTIEENNDIEAELKNEEDLRANNILGIKEELKNIKEEIVLSNRRNNNILGNTSYITLILSALSIILIYIAFFKN